MIDLIFEYDESCFNLHLSTGRYTVVYGDSSQGKSLFISCLTKYLLSNGALVIDGFSLVTLRSWRDIKATIEEEVNTVIFVDESDVNSLGNIAFSKITWGSNNHLVLFTRSDLSWLPYGVFDCFIMERSLLNANQHNMIPVVSFYRKKDFPVDDFCIICEDRGLGFRFVQSIYSEDSVDVIASNGKGNLFKKIMQNSSKGVVVIASDLCGWDGITLELLGLHNVVPHVNVLLSRSFEYELLRYLLKLNGVKLSDFYTDSPLSAKSEESYYFEGLSVILESLYGIAYGKDSDEVFDLFTRYGTRGCKGKPIDTSLSWLYPELSRSKFSTSKVKRMKFS